MSSIIPTPGLLHGRLQSTLASSDRSSSNKKLYSTLPTKVDDIKVTAMRSFLMTGAVGRTRADIAMPERNTNDRTSNSSELKFENTNEGKSRKESILCLFTFTYVSIVNKYIIAYTIMLI